MAQKRNVGRLPKYDPRETNAALSAELRDALHEKLTLQQLCELEKQLRRSLETSCRKAAVLATEEAYKRSFAVVFRVLRDRHGYGHKRLRQLFDDCLEYIHDIDAGRMTTREMLDCLENEDGIKITWNVMGDING